MEDFMVDGWNRGNYNFSGFGPALSVQPLDLFRRWISAGRSGGARQPAGGAEFIRNYEA
jgi:hypothetical protein